MRKRLPTALMLSLLLHAALFAAMVRLTISQLSVPAGAPLAAPATMLVSFVLVPPPNAPETEPEPAPAPPIPPPPPPAVEPPPPPASEAMPPPAPAPILTSAPSVPVVSMPPAPAPSPKRSMPSRPARPTRATAGETLPRGERGGDAVVVAATCTFRATPDFPTKARLARQQGAVVVVVSLDASAHVTAVRIATSSGFPQLDAAALAAARRCRFHAATRNGQPTASEVRVPYTFRLDR